MPQGLQSIGAGANIVSGVVSRAFAAGAHVSARATAFFGAGAMLVPFTTNISIGAAARIISLTQTQTLSAGAIIRANASPSFGAGAYIAEPLTAYVDRVQIVRARQRVSTARSPYGKSSTGA